MVTRAGEQRWVHMQRRPVWDDGQQRVVRYYGVARDITGQKRAEAELRRRDAILRAVSAAADRFLRASNWQAEIREVLGILGESVAVDRAVMYQIHANEQGVTLASARYEWDAPGVPSILANPLSQNIDLFRVGLGSLLDQLALRHPLFMHTGAPDLLPEFLKVARELGTRTALYLPVILHGTPWGALQLVMIREEREWSRPENEALQIAADMLGTVMEGKQAEEALAKERKLLRTVIDNLPDNIFVKDRLSRFILNNAESLRILGIPRQEDLLGKTDFDFFPREQAAAWCAQEQAIMQSGQPLLDVEEFQPWHPDRRRWIVGSTIPLRDEAGIIIGVIGISRDITERKHLEEEVRRRTEQLESMVEERTAQLRQAKEEAEAANRAKGVFLANMNHELRTPLNAVLGFTHLLRSGANLTAEQRENLAIVERSGQHLLDLINDVLDMSKIEAGRMTLDASTFDLYATLREVEQLIGLRAAARRLPLRVELAANVPRFVVSDQRKLRQILINLLANAVKFTDVGGIVLRVHYAAEAQNQPGRLSVEVEDTGPGIAPGEIEKLFQPFSQTETGQALQQGTGLGLAITRQFVRLLGGEIAVRSQVGQGTTFAFTVQVQPGTPPPAPENIANRRVVGLAPGQAVYRILVADDAEENRLLLHKLLAQVGFEVREAADGKTAVALFAAWQPHLIFMDMRMPVLDGYEATRQIKASTQGQAVAIIALTATALEGTRPLVLSAGCDDYLQKPVALSDLFAKIERHLGVQFLYKVEETGRSELPGGYAGAVVLTRADLAVLPGAWIRDFHARAVMADSNGMLGQIEAIAPGHPQLAGALTNLVRTFDLTSLLALTSMPTEQEDDHTEGKRQS